MTPDDLADIKRHMERSMLELKQLRAEVAALHDRVCVLETPPAKASPRRPAPPPETVSSRPEPVIHVRRETAAAPTAADPPTLDPAWQAELLARYAEAALDLSGAGERFIAERRPAAATRTPGQDGYTLGGDPYGAMLWAVSAPDGVYAVLPGYKALNNWGALLAPNRTTTAAEFLGDAFDLEPGPGRFALAAPALARRTGGGMALTTKGRLSGFRS